MIIIGGSLWVIGFSTTAIYPCPAQLGKTPTTPFHPGALPALDWLCLLIGEKMKIIDSFMFSEPYEESLLLLKLQMENDVINQWIIIEGCYSFQGEYKGLYLRDMLENNNIFLPYKDRIKVLEITKNFNELYLMSPLEYLNRYLNTVIPFQFRNSFVSLSEEAAFFAEKMQRDVAIDYILKNFNDNDILILTDVDEMLDVTTQKNKDDFFNIFKRYDSQILCHKLRRKIFIYDFDNLCYRKRYIPMISIRMVKKIKSKIRKNVAQYIKHHLVWQGMEQIHIGEELFYEFTYCFDRSNILRKTKTFAHTGRGELDIERALLCNHSFKDISKINQDYLLNKENWFEKVDINLELPAIIIDNFNILRTRSVAENYKEMRFKYYGI